MDNRKVLERIRKLLAMARDVSSPHEAVIAAGRARKLMDQHQVTELDLTSLDADQFESLEYTTGNKGTDKFTGLVALAVASLNDCIVMWRSGNGYKYVQFDGLLGDAVCSVELMQYLRGEAYRQAERNVTENNSFRVRADRGAYRVGFAKGVVAKVKELVAERRKVELSDGRSLVIVKGALVKQKFGVQRVKETTTRVAGSREAANAGYSAGYKANVGRVVTGTKQARLS